jgi:hypothetical protein
VLVRKKNAEIRFGVDNRKLNGVTKKDSFPLPKIDILDTLAGAKWFSTPVLEEWILTNCHAPDDKQKTAFSTGQGLWKFTVTPFGLCNAPATFERLMESVLRGLTDKACLENLEDVTVVGRTFQEQLNDLRKVFQRYRKAPLKVNPEKSQLFQKLVGCVGHIASPEGVTTDPEKLEAEQRWTQPGHKHELRSFLGLCTYKIHSSLEFPTSPNR